MYVLDDRWRSLLSEGFTTLTEEKKLELRQMLELLEKHYPQRWDVSDEGVVQLLFPEVTITNSEGMTHLIIELYVRFKFKEFDNQFMLDNEIKFSGVRGTISNAEYYRGYRHSHLTGKGKNSTSTSYSTFCQGSGSTMQQLTQLLATTDFHLDQFEMFLLMIDNYVRWESLEGVPHMRIKNIKASPSQGRVHAIDRNTDIENILEYLGGLWKSENIDVSGMEIEIVNGKPIIVDNDWYGQELFKITPDCHKCHEIGQQYVHPEYLDNLGDYPTVNENTRVTTDLVFRNQPVRLKFYNIEQGESVIGPLVPAPTMRLDFLHKLNNDFYKKLYEERAYSTKKR